MATRAKIGPVQVIAQATSGSLLTPKETSELLCVPEGTLAQWRSQRRGPAFLKLEDRLVRYRRSDLEHYIASKIVAPLENA